MKGKFDISAINGVDIRRDGFWARLASRLVPPLVAGRLVVQLPSGAVFDRTGAASGPEVLVCVHSWRALLRLALGGEVAFAGSYLEGEWSTPDLLRFFELVMLNEKLLLTERPRALPARLLARLRHGWRRNTRRGSRRNIAAHYDLGNDFYKPWLDKGMTYSAALFAGNETLEEAQQNKIDRIAKMLEMKGGERVLEIGCGWGALAKSLVRQNGCHVTAITLSDEQYAFASDRLRPETDAGMAEIRLQDYRDAEGCYDCIVSIEMFEAVGEAYWSTYFAMLKQRLVEGGTAVIQVITIAEERFDHYSRSPDFIQRYIFPGGMLPTKTHLHDLAAKAGLRISLEFSFGEGYAKTLAEWRKRFQQAWPRLEILGFDERFRRMWEYYLAYCETGFRAGASDVTLFQLKQA
jgi:cyclopropane-fatty-acyl-phospholipid synthase